MCKTRMSCRAGSACCNFLCSARSITAERAHSIHKRSGPSGSGVTSKECIHHASDMLLQLTREQGRKAQNYGLHVHLDCTFVPNCQRQRKVSLGIRAAGTSALPFPSHGSKNSPRVYRRGEQKAKEIVNWSEML